MQRWIFGLSDPRYQFLILETHLIYETEIHPDMLYEGSHSLSQLS